MRFPVLGRFITVELLHIVQKEKIGGVNGP
jgi:hypothetical protein